MSDSQKCQTPFQFNVLRGHTMLLVGRGNRALHYEVTLAVDAKEFAAIDIS